MANTLNMDDYEAFREGECFSKEDLIKWLDMFLENNSLNGKMYSSGRIEVIQQRIAEFRQLLVESDIPTLTEPWKFYGIDFNEEGIVANIWECEDFKTDGDGCDERTSCLVDCVLSLKCNYLSVNNFANLQGVKQERVARWLKDGLLNGARKENGVWMVSEFASKSNSRHYEATNYSSTNESAFTKAKEWFWFLAGNSISIDGTPGSYGISCQDNYVGKQDDEKIKMIRRLLVEDSNVCVRDGMTGLDFVPGVY